MNLFEPIWAQYYAPHLTKTELGQLRRAKSGHQSILLTGIIKKQGFSARHRTYMPVASTKDVPGRNHYVAARLIDEIGDTDWEAQCLFANALRVASHGDEDFNVPSARVVVAPYHILTIEFDAANIGFFQQQLGWLRSPNNALDSVVGKFVAHLRSSYADVAGLSVVYSGHKSLHFHFIVSTELLSGAVPNPTSLRFGFQKAWDRLQAEFEGFALFNLPVGMKADPSLRQPETFRRLPGGMRLNDKDNHLFGVPVGEPLFQGLLWEYLKLERGGGGKATLLDPADFMALPVARPRGQAPKSTPSSMDGGSEVDAYACQKLAALFDGTTAHPRFSHLDRSSGAPVAHFYNHPSDQHPTSVMRVAFATVLIQGSNPLGLTNDATSGGLLMSRLPHPLETMLEIWAGEYQCEQMGPGGRMRSPVEAAFAEAAVDRPTATDAMGRILLGSLMENIGRPETHLLCAPEGISKTRSLMAAAPDIIAALREANRPSWLMFAFPTYEGAEEKLEEFKAMHAASMGDMAPMLLPSFDRMYRNLCQNRARLTHERAARDGRTPAMRRLVMSLKAEQRNRRRAQESIWLTDSASVRA
ncbi:hypothetical protein [Brevundimonas sp. KM4]|uniref:hypothetical protein n=1 Tax=Brevundimonas sp. KM4 TaxID=1628191 RepID=UPI0005F7F222|nr:hypothetical protein [Brevundimonas sp. KM4]KJV38095.1 hypothetical protein VH88_15045 [Brevundimonas sp. KM4]